MFCGSGNNVSYRWFEWTKVPIQTTRADCFCPAKRSTKRMDIRNIIHRSNNRTQIRKFSSGYMAKVIQYYRRYLGPRKLEEIIPSYMASFPHSLGLIHHIFNNKPPMAKKTGWPLWAFFKATTFSRSNF